MTADQANDALALINEHLEEYKRSFKKKGKKAKKTARGKAGSLLKRGQEILRQRGQEALRS
jgi:ElaB/YqjD/DUF883 family membrane-anchored ribosome-binding protein